MVGEKSCPAVSDAVRKSGVLGHASTEFLCACSSRSPQTAYHAVCVALARPADSEYPFVRLGSAVPLGKKAIKKFSNRKVEEFFLELLAGFGPATC